MVERLASKASFSSQQKYNNNIVIFMIIIFLIQIILPVASANTDVDNLEILLTTCSELHLPVVGLMCIPPVSEDPYPHFETLRGLKEKYNLRELSMGMSNDFEKAISAGASYIRVGSAIFGQRP